MDFVRFNQLSEEEKLRIVSEAGRFVYCSGNKGEETINVYVIRTFYVEVAVHNVMSTIRWVRARVF